MKLNILISTHNEKVANVASLLLPARDDVSYVVSYQYSDNEYLKLIPKEFKREDIRFVPMQGLGLCKSRNNAIAFADGDIALIADDDVRYTDEYINSVLSVFKANLKTDVALFKIRTRDNEPPMKRYPLVAGRYKPMKGYFPSSIEMAFKLSSIKNKVTFDERFGLGSEFLNSGEEEVFIKDCQKAGLRVDFFPHYVVEHPYQSTGKNHLSMKSLRSRGAVSSYLHGYSAYFRMIKFSIFMSLRGRSNIFNLLRNTLWGVAYQRRTRR